MICCNKLTALMSRFDLYQNPVCQGNLSEENLRMSLSRYLC